LSAGFHKIQTHIDLLVDFHWRWALHRYANLTDVEHLVEIEHLTPGSAAETGIGRGVHFLAHTAAAIE
jgi:hypothetical protein